MDNLRYSYEALESGNDKRETNKGVSWSLANNQCHAQNSVCHKFATSTLSTQLCPWNFVPHNFALWTVFPQHYLSQFAYLTLALQLYPPQLCIFNFVPHHFSLSTLSPPPTSSPQFYPPLLCLFNFVTPNFTHWTLSFLQPPHFCPFNFVPTILSLKLLPLICVDHIVIPEALSHQHYLPHLCIFKCVPCRLSHST